jgi:hypothetical protein
MRKRPAATGARGLSSISPESPAPWGDCDPGASDGGGQNDRSFFAGRPRAAFLMVLFRLAALRLRASQGFS